MWTNVAADLYDDLPVIAQWNLGDGSEPPPARDIRGHCASKREEASSRKRHAPHREEVAQRLSGPVELDNTRWRQRAQRVAAARSDADVLGDDYDAPVGEELEMNTDATR